MSIAGIGTDLVEIARLAAALERYGERFGDRILGPEERAEWRRCGRSPRFLAKRFAAKEAAAKALGTGFRNGVRFADIEVVHDALGKPGLRFSAAAARRASELRVVRSELSISDERAYALAFVVLIREG
ncbi:MAG: holo-ACP synthase [Xanthomonadaceae bacterium]|nr:holo-ACP synthase [Xanthomonadaceae bacterium]